MSPMNKNKESESLITEEINLDLDTRILDEGEKMPFAIYFIIPNELAERFCFYGIRPLLRNFYMSSLGFTETSSDEMYHIFNMLAYFFPLFGAAISDSYLDKFRTISILSIIYVIGVVILAITATPHVLGIPPEIPAWGPLLGLLFVAIGTGGIKPCVSAHGGDQFLSMQKFGLNKFYNYFYMSINVGALAAGFLIPMIQAKNFYGNDGDGYPVGFGICAGVMALATGLFIGGYRWYRVIPPAGIFLPYQLFLVGCSYVFRFFRNNRDSMKTKEQVEDEFGPELLEEFLDVSKVGMAILPAAFFWMAFDQSGSSWQGLSDQMNPNNFLSSVVLNAVLNPVFIVILSPLFANYVYPCIEHSFPRKFGLLSRMVTGMMLAGVAFLICASFQNHIDTHCQWQELTVNGKTRKLCIDPNMSTAWFIIPYFVLTVAEVLFSISGLNFTYNEVGKRMKSSCAALWLLTVAFGNLLTTVLYAATESWDRTTYFYLVSGLCFIAAVFQWSLNKFYVYKADRKEN